MNNPAPIHNPEQDIVEYKVRRAAGINALHRMGKIVAREQKTDTEKTNLLRWFTRYGWIVLLFAALLATYAWVHLRGEM